MEVRPARTEFIHADGRTDITKLIVVFRNFANAPKTPLGCTTAFKETNQQK
jgi:hypothetical protein